MFIELVVWEVPSPLRGSLHHYKYRLALISDGKCVLRYDDMTMSQGKETIST
ncbi:toxin-antitoxin system TumE family protein [Acetobacter pasteurianus]